MKHLFIVLFAIIFISSFAFAQSNTASVTTDGNNNTATATQIGSGNEAVIDQTAHTSTATQYQEGSNNEATITQYGRWPAGHVVNQVAIQNQTGSGHEADIRQIVGANSGDSKSEQFQDGIGHYARSVQNSNFSEVFQTQYGEGHDAEAYQVGSGNYIYQYQDGKANRTRVDPQTGFGAYKNNIAIQEQRGNWNNALIEQYDINGVSSWPGANGNRAEIYQTGYDNWAGDGYGAATDYGIRQWGDNNTAIVMQNDVANKSQVFQHGDGNTVNVDQSGGVGLFGDPQFGIYWNISDVTQTGDGNTATVTQTYVP